jgi:hypothetical protein
VRVAKVWAARVHIVSPELVIFLATGGESIGAGSHQLIQLWLDASASRLVARLELIVQNGQIVENHRSRSSSGDGI